MYHGVILVFAHDNIHAGNIKVNKNLDKLIITFINIYYTEYMYNVWCTHKMVTFTIYNTSPRISSHTMYNKHLRLDPVQAHGH